MLEKSHLSDIVCRELQLDCPQPDLSDWEHMVQRIKNRDRQVTIGLVGKYVELHDAYLSVAEALRHAGYYQDAEVLIEWLDSEQITAENAGEVLGKLDGIIIPGGFGKRGIEGMITAAQYARENRLPYFGICLGMQVAVIEFARNVAGLKNAHSGEFAQDVPKVIDYLPDQSDQTDKGGTLRLGAYPCVLQENTVIKAAYGKTHISERHRHRYEFNNQYRERLQSSGLRLSGLSPDKSLVETIEISDRDFYIGVQYHPEFKSRPNKPHPLFSVFIRAALRGRNES
jgi:CTP synthase